METQEELKRGKGFFFESRYPVWQCPDCDWLNRFVNTFFEVCGGCSANHTLDWREYILEWEAEGDAGMKAIFNPVKDRGLSDEVVDVESRELQPGRVFIFPSVLSNERTRNAVLYNVKVAVNWAESIMWQKLDEKIVPCCESESEIAIAFWVDRPFKTLPIYGQFYGMSILFPGFQDLKMRAERIKFESAEVIMLDDTEVFSQGWPDDWPVQLIEYRFVSVAGSKVEMSKNLSADGWATEETADPRVDIEAWKEKILGVEEE